jgi:hypothetical protein
VTSPRRDRANAPIRRGSPPPQSARPEFSCSIPLTSLNALASGAELHFRGNNPLLRPKRKHAPFILVSYQANTPPPRLRKRPPAVLGFEVRESLDAKTKLVSTLGKTQPALTAHGQRATSNDPGLTAVVEAWECLPEAVRAGILAMVRASRD